MAKALTLEHFLARTHLAAAALWRTSADGWRMEASLERHSKPFCDEQVSAYTCWAEDAEARANAAPVKIIAVYADGRTEEFV
jgi:hypothetical protein